jgi:hypothetical protein
MDPLLAFFRRPDLSLISDEATMAVVVILQADSAP